ncbi:hypothetical protein ACETU7_13525 [Rhodococcus sp. 3Y1]
MGGVLRHRDSCVPHRFAVPTTHSAAPPRNIWMRSAQRLSDDPLIHVAALAYASDLMLMATALTPHGYDIGQEHSLDTDWTGVSLDHTMWFQRPVRADEWLLFEHSTPQLTPAEQ